MTDTTAPRTAAGKRLVTHLTEFAGIDPTDAVLAIEDELLPRNCVAVDAGYLCILREFYGSAPGSAEAIEPLLALVRTALDSRDANAAYQAYVDRPLKPDEAPDFEPWGRMVDAERDYEEALAALPESVRVAARKPE